MRRILMVAALVLMTPAFLQAQMPKWSIGAGVLGITYETESELVSVLMPGGGGDLGFANVFIGAFPSENIAIRPGLSFEYLTNGGSFYNIAVEAQFEYHISGVTMNSPYVFATGLFNALGNGGSENDFAVGGGAGYRYIVYDFWALMFEVTYRRWLDFELNQITGALKMEVIFN